MAGVRSLFANAILSYLWISNGVNQQCPARRGNRERGEWRRVHRIPSRGLLSAPELKLGLFLAISSASLVICTIRTVSARMAGPQVPCLSLRSLTIQRCEYPVTDGVISSLVQWWQWRSHNPRCPRHSSFPGLRLDDALSVFAVIDAICNTALWET